MNNNCSEKSKFKNDPRYECNLETGRYRLKKGYKKQATEGAPKRPSSAYFLWSQQNRPQFKSQYPDAKVTELAQIMGASWKQLPEEQKANYQQEAARAKKQYGEEASQFKEQNGSLTQIIEKTKQKKSPSGYILFSKHIRPEIKQESPELKFGEMSKELGNRWKQLSQQEQQIWNNQAANLKRTLG